MNQKRKTSLDSNMGGYVARIRADDNERSIYYVKDTSEIKTKEVHDNGVFSAKWLGVQVFDTISEAKIWMALSRNVFLKKRIKSLKNIIDTSPPSTYYNEVLASTEGELKKTEKWLEGGKIKYPEMFV